MRIGLITTHSFPIPHKTHTGDVVILDLAHAFSALGHEVYLFAPDGTAPPPNGKQFTMPCSMGAPVNPGDYERKCYSMYTAELLSCDIVHEFSVHKQITDSLFKNNNYKNTTCTYLGGNWSYPDTPRNAIVWSNAMRDRALRGATDYENTPTPNLGGPPHKPLKDAHIVYGGVNTKWYSPTYQKENFFLWMNRWHPAKGYQVAIELAKRTGINLVMAGEHPDNETFDYQKQCALEAVKLAEGHSNIKFEWLPLDPEHHIVKRDLYRRAKALLYTVQFQEPFGLSQTEALSCATPVIGVNFGSVPEVITDGLTGYVRNNNIDELIQAIQLINNIDIYNCRTEAVNRFDISVMAKSYIKEYQSIINGNSW